MQGQVVIRVGRDTAQKLRAIGRKKDTDDTIIRLLLKLYEEKYGEARKELNGFFDPLNDEKNKKR